MAAACWHHSQIYQCSWRLAAAGARNWLKWRRRRPRNVASWNNGESWKPENKWPYYDWWRGEIQVSAKLQPASAMANGRRPASISYGPRQRISQRNGWQLCSYSRRNIGSCGSADWLSALWPAGVAKKWLYENIGMQREAASESTSSEAVSSRKSKKYRQTSKRENITQLQSAKNISWKLWNQEKINEMSARIWLMQTTLASQCNLALNEKRRKLSMKMKITAKSGTEAWN